MIVVLGVVDAKYKRYVREEGGPRESRAFLGKVITNVERPLVYSHGELRFVGEGGASVRRSRRVLACNAHTTTTTTLLKSFGSSQVVAHCRYSVLLVVVEPST